MAMEPHHTDNVGLGISGADQPADNQPEPKQSQSPEQASPHNSEEELEWENVDLGIPQTTEPIDDSTQPKEVSDQPEDDPEQPGTTIISPETIEEWENFKNNNSPEQVNSETVSHFSSSSDEDEDGEDGEEDDNDEAISASAVLDVDDGMGQTRSDGADLFDDEIPTVGIVSSESDSGPASAVSRPRSPPKLWQVTGEQDRGYFYHQRPSSPVFGFSGDDDSIYRNDRKWLWHGQISEGKKRSHDAYPPPHPRPTRLRKVRSVDDISPETSPKSPSNDILTLKTPETSSHPLSNDVLIAKKSWADIDEEGPEEDEKRFNQFIEESNRRHSESYAPNRSTADGDVRRYSEGDVPNRSPVDSDAETDPTAGPTTTGVRETGDNGANNGSEDAGEGIVGGTRINSVLADGSDEDDADVVSPGGDTTESPHLDDASDDDVPKVRAFTPTPSDSVDPPEQPQSSQDSPDIPTEEDEDGSKPPPQNVGSLGEDADGEEPTSPTPSNAESIESTTGMTQSQGLEAADKYIEDTHNDLAKQRSRLKDQHKGNPMTEALPEKPEERIQLLEAKVHQYRGMRDNARDEVKYLRERYSRAEEEMRRRWKEHKEEMRAVITEHNGAVDHIDGQDAHIDGLDTKIDGLDREIAALKERNRDLLKQLEQAEDQARAWHDKFQEAQTSKAKAEQRVAQWKFYAESNAELAECERRRRETETQDVGTDTNDLPSQVPIKGAETADTSTQTTNSDSVGQAAELQADKTDSATQTTRTEGPRYVNSDTQTDPPATAPTARLPRQLQPAPLLPEGAIRWPAATRQDTVAHIAQWINAAHGRETRQPIAQLTATQVEQFFSNGETSFEQLLSILEQAGYVFRPDHFALAVERYTRDKGSINLEAMHFYRRVDPLRQHPSQRLLEEINDVRSDLAALEDKYEKGVSEDLVERMNQCASLNVQLQERESALDECRAKLELCHEHGTQLEHEKGELEHTLAELTDRLMASGSESSSAESTPKIDQSELDLLKDQLASCRAHGSKLERQVQDLETTKQQLTLECAGYKDQMKDIEGLLSEESAVNGTLKSDLEACHTHGEELQASLTGLEDEKQALKLTVEGLESELTSRDARIRELGDTRAGLENELSDIKKAQESDQVANEDQKKAGVDVEKIRLQREVDRLNVERNTHIRMLEVARDHIEALKARAEKLAIQNGGLRSSIAPLEAVASDSVPNTPVTPPFPQGPATTSRRQLQTNAILTPLDSPMPRSPGSTSVPLTPATSSFAPSQPAHWTNREARIQNSEAYKRTREALRMKRQAEEQQQAKLGEQRNEAYKKLFSSNKVPYVPKEKRWTSLRKQEVVA